MTNSVTSPSPTIPLLPDDLAEPAELVAAIRARRGGTLLKLDRALLHSPAFAQGWNVFLGQVRNELTVSLELRELAICAVAILNHANYEFEHHRPIFQKAGGTPEQADALRHLGRTEFDWSLFSPVQADVLALTMAMTREIEVPAHLKQRLIQALSIPETVELIGVVACYNMVSRFLRAMEIEQE